MHPSEKQELLQHLNSLIKRIDESIEAIETRAVQLNLVASKMMTADGHHMLSPLLVAKAEALHSRILLITHKEK